MDKDKYLMKQCFENLNNLKRSMTLEEIERDKGNIDKAMQHELMKYRMLARLELSMRGLQNELGKDSESET